MSLTLSTQQLLCIIIKEVIMKAKAVRLHAANDLRLDEFELPEIKDDEILVKVISDTVCMSTHKCAILGVEHKRVHGWPVIS